MSTIQTMANSHPLQSGVDQNGKLAANLLASTVEILIKCAQICQQCADACLGEPGVEHLRRCIRTDLDCATICSATATVLSRQTEVEWDVVRAQLEACIVACRTCAEECGKHADHHEHCRICAEICSECEEACKRALQSAPA